MTLDEELEEAVREIEWRRKRPNIKLFPFDQVELSSEPEYVIEGLIPDDGITIVRAKIAQVFFRL
jgi:hypothetical protein